jgi:hypothetical protein
MFGVASRQKSVAVVVADVFNVASLLMSLILTFEQRR